MSDVSMKNAKILQNLSMKNAKIALKLSIKNAKNIEIDFENNTPIVDIIHNELL